MNHRKGRKILFFLKKQNGLLQCIASPCTNLVPEFTCWVFNIFNLGQKHMIEFTDFQFDGMKPMWLKGDHFDAVLGDVQNSLALALFLSR
ncbi:MAG: hypothetical protein HON06_02860 [Candidatus Puniceispirillum sp.]|nr:hypothetical protein [Candidatus Puniceispirillum sp.]